MRRPWQLALAVFAAAALTYAPALRNGFAWDDAAIVVANPDTRDLGAVPRVALSPDEVAPYYRPLNRVSYLLDYRLYGMNPAGFHATGVLLHAASAALLFLAGLRLFRAAAPALVAALLFAVHPVNAEAVNFISGRNNLFAAFFMLGSWLAFGRALERRSAAAAAASGGLFLAALLSKEPAVLLLPALAAALARPALLGAAPGWPRPRALALVPHAAALALYLALRHVALGGLLGAAGGPATAPLVARLAVNLESVPRYLGLVAWPAGLSTWHPVSGQGVDLAAWMIPAWAVVVAAFAALARAGGAPARAGLLFAALQFLPIANVVPIPSEAVAERYAYLPAIGLWLALAGALAPLLARPRLRREAGALVLVVLVALAGRTVVRSADWRDDLALARSTVRVYPGHARPRADLGTAFRDAGDLPAAVREWEAALRLDPRQPDALTQLGTVAALDGRWAEAERKYRAALDADPRAPLARYNLGQVLERTGRPLEAAAAYEAFLRVARSPYLEYVAPARGRLEALRRGPVE